MSWLLTQFMELGGVKVKRKILAILSIAVAVLAIFAVASIVNGFGLEMREPCTLLVTLSI